MTSSFDAPENYGPKDCDSCGRSMVLESGKMLIGAELAIMSTSEENKQQMEKLYPEIEIGRTYRVCWVCLMSRYGVKFE